MAEKREEANAGTADTGRQPGVAVPPLHNPLRREPRPRGSSDQVAAAFDEAIRQRRVLAFDPGLHLDRVQAVLIGALTEVENLKRAWAEIRTGVQSAPEHSESPLGR